MVEGAYYFFNYFLGADYLGNLNYLNCDLVFNSDLSVLKLPKRSYATKLKAFN